MVLPMSATLVVPARSLALAVALLALSWAPPRGGADAGLAAEEAPAKDAAAAGAGGAEPAAEPAAKAPPKDGLLPDTALAFVNDQALAVLKNWATKRNLNPTMVGTGSVRALTMGAAPADLAAALAKGALTMQGLEYITGDQETFIAKKPTDGQCIVLALFASKGDVNSFIDDMRAAKIMPPAPPQGDDLLKKHPAWPWPRMMLACQEDVGKLLPEWAVYSATVLSVDAFFNSRSPPQATPTWLREGLACDMQQTVCKDIRDVSISYEDKQFPMSQNWANDIRKLIDSGSPSNKEASVLMRIPLDACPNVFYQQFWSLTTYIRLNTATTKGPRNKLRRLLDALASGEQGIAAYTKIYGQSDQQLTRAWRIWADDQH